MVRMFDAGTGEGIGGRKAFGCRLIPVPVSAGVLANVIG